MIGLHSIPKEHTYPKLPVRTQNAIMSFIRRYDNLHPVWIRQSTAEYGYYFQGDRDRLSTLDYSGAGGWPEDWLTDYPSDELIDWSLIEILP